jgi:hypothetical protein
MANVRISKNQGYRTLIHGQFNADSLRVNKFSIDDYTIISNSASFLDFDFSPNGDYIVFSRYGRHSSGRIAPSISFFNNISQRIYHLGEGSYPVVNDKGFIFYQKNDLTENAILVYDIISKKTESFLSLNPENQIGELRLNKKGDKLAVSIFDQDRNFLVAIFDTETAETIELLQLNNMPQELLWKTNSTLAITIENASNFVTDVITFDIENSKMIEFYTPPFNVFPRFIADSDKGLNIISLNEVDRIGRSLGIVNLHEKHTPSLSIGEEDTERGYCDTTAFIASSALNYYTRWLFAEPTHKIPATIQPYTFLEQRRYNSLRNIGYSQSLILPFSDYFFGTIVFMEPLGKHLIACVATVRYDFDESPQWVIQYINNSFKPSISFTSLRTNWFAGWTEDEIVRSTITTHSVNAIFPYNIYNRQFTSLSYGFGVSHHLFRLQDSAYNFSDYYEESELVQMNAFIGYLYDLPWRNSMFHPVRRHQIDLGVDFSRKELGSSRNHEQLKLFSEIAYAPFINKGKWEIFKTAGIHNRIHYRVVGNSPQRQHLPGIDDFENVSFAGRPLFSRLFLRGFEESLWGKEIVSTQTDLRFKLTNNLDFSVNWGQSWLSSGYLGFSVWGDYTKVSQIQGFSDVESYRSREFKAIGYEIQSHWNILLVPTLHRFGQAYSPSGDELLRYWMMEIPLVSF